MIIKNTIFEKPPLAVPEQLKLLTSRGLIIQDDDAAAHYLKFISYYRFCGYGIEFEDISAGAEKRYLPGTTFDQILDYYVFDRKLRLLIIDAIERVEVAIRTVISHELALKYGAHWYLNKRLFLKGFNHDALISTVKRETFYKSQDDSIQKNKKREQFIQHYYETYDNPELPPIWMVAEVLSLGTWSIIFANLNDRVDQKLICSHFGVNYKVMTSWLHSLTYVRNLCAHHGKLWSRKFTLTPMLANQYREQLENNTKFVAQTVILKVFLDVVSPDSHWALHLYKLMQKHPGIDISRMGFKENWFYDPFWGIVPEVLETLVRHSEVTISGKG